MEKSPNVHGSPVDSGSTPGQSVHAHRAKQSPGPSTIRGIQSKKMPKEKMDDEYDDDECSSVSSIDSDENVMNIWDNSQLMLRGIDIETFTDYYRKKLSFLQLFKLRSTFYSKATTPNTADVFKGAEKIYKFCNSSLNLEEFLSEDRMHNIVDLNLSKDRNASQFMRYFDDLKSVNKTKNRQPQYDRYSSIEQGNLHKSCSPRKKNTPQSALDALGLSPRKIALHPAPPQRKSQMTLDQLNEMHRKQRQEMQPFHWEALEDTSPLTKGSQYAVRCFEEEVQYEQQKQQQSSEITQDNNSQQKLTSKHRLLNMLLSAQDRSLCSTKTNSEAPPTMHEDISNHKNNMNNNNTNSNSSSSSNYLNNTTINNFYHPNSTHRKSSKSVISTIPSQNLIKYPIKISANNNHLNASENNPTDLKLKVRTENSIEPTLGVRTSQRMTQSTNMSAYEGHPNLAKHHKQLSQSSNPSSSSQSSYPQMVREGGSSINHPNRTVTTKFTNAYISTTQNRANPRVVIAGGSGQGGSGPLQQQSQQSQPIESKSPSRPVIPRQSAHTSHGTVNANLLASDIRLPNIAGATSSRKTQAAVPTTVSHNNNNNTTTTTTTAPSSTLTASPVKSKVYSIRHPANTKDQLLSSSFVQQQSPPKQFQSAQITQRSDIFTRSRKLNYSVPSGTGVLNSVQDKQESVQISAKH